jgi:hypothetical protein
MGTCLGTFADLSRSTGKENAIGIMYFIGALILLTALIYGSLTPTAIRVHYCGEQVDNDGSIGSVLLKNVKRVMGNIAASYRSRSLPDNAGLSNTAFAKVVLLGLVCGGS